MRSFVFGSVVLVACGGGSSPAQDAPKPNDDAAAVADAAIADTAIDATIDAPLDAPTDAPPTPTLASGLIAAGSLHACALLGGSVKCWGSNEYGQLGSGTASGVDTTSNAVLVPDITNAIAIAAGYGHTCALIQGGTVKCWGRGNAGQLGDDLSQTSATARTVKDLTNAIAISSHWDYSCALRADGHVVCWGVGAIGDNTSEVRTKPTEPIGITDAIAVTAAWGHTTIIRAGGSAKAWGKYNHWGQIGDGSTAIERLAPVDVVNLSTATQVSSGSYHSCALLENGTVRCWGNAQLGSIGLGVQDSNRHATPADVPGLANVVSLGSGGTATCAITASGSVYCWGNHTGHPTTPLSSSPIEIASLANALEIEGNNEHMCARFANDVVKCWGDNSYNQLGTGTGMNSQTPITVPGL